jgi:hypothetical protein
MKTEEPQAPVGEQEKLKPLTAEEQAIASRISKSDESWREPITEEAMLDYSLSRDQYALPEEAAQKQNAREYAFRWVEKKTERIDLITSLPIPARWFICNRANTPFLEKHIDPVHGGVQRLDQILMFKPWRMHEAHQGKKMDLAALKDQQGTVETRHGMKDEKAEWMAGEQFKIGSRDEVVTDSLEFVSASED